MKKWNKERFATIWENLESMIKLRSLRARIFLLILVIGLVPCIVMRHGIVSNYEDMAVEQRIGGAEPVDDPGEPPGQQQLFEQPRRQRGYRQFPRGHQCGAGDAVQSVRRPCDDH